MVVGRTIVFLAVATILIQCGTLSPNAFILVLLLLTRVRGHYIDTFLSVKGHRNNDLGAIFVGVPLYRKHSWRIHAPTGGYQSRRPYQLLLTIHEKPETTDLLQSQGVRIADHIVNVNDVQKCSNDLNLGSIAQKNMQDRFYS